MVAMKSQEAPVPSVKRPTLTPKALIYQKYKAAACYSIEEVKQDADNLCPGLVIQQQVKTLYRCRLDLPDLSVTSDTFPRKKDAEQSAARIAIEKLGIQSTTSNPTPEEASLELVGRISSLFTHEFLSSSHPLISHFGVAFGANRVHFGMIPVAAIAACDVKVNNLCKIINCKAESDPYLVSSLIMNAAQKSPSLCTAEDGLWIWKQAPYSLETIEIVISRDSGPPGCIQIGAVCIPCCIEEDVEELALNVSSDHYYLDIIAQKLNVKDSCHILVSRTVGKASSEIKLYFPFTEGNGIKPMLNKRASYLSGQDIFGDAILANIGYSWKSSNLHYEDVSLCNYYRLLLAKLPDGHYKLSREAILAAELPTVYTGRSNWKGPTPKDILCAFCRQHRLPEPLFSVLTVDTDTPSDAKLKSDVSHNNLDNSGAFQCEVKILSRSMETVLIGSFADTHRKESDSIQCSALNVLLWFNKFFKNLGMFAETISSLRYSDGISVNTESIRQEFTMFLCIFGHGQNHNLQRCSLLDSFCEADPSRKHENGMVLLKIEGPEFSILPSSGSLIYISYSVSLLRVGDPVKYLLESKEEFEFEVGTGTVIHQLETCASQLSVNQSALFVIEAPSRDVILAAAGEAAKCISEIPHDDCFLEYSLKVLRVTEPLEDRMEQALFSPSLSKQRVEFAIRCINESNASTLVDFGCGSGSLLDSLLDHTTTLEKIVGVDISRKSLTRAAKILHQKLSLDSGARTSIRHAELYDGSIILFDSRLSRVDIGTCLEVIEHMEEDQARFFGDVVLSSFCPRALVVSTPNYEYNSILQKSSVPASEENAVPRKFRNHDHKFEWTREQFERWATDLASTHNYSVEFSGVGGSADVEPGFASQIAVFRRSSAQLVDDCTEMEEGSSQPYELIWEWSDHLSRSAL